LALRGKEIATSTFRSFETYAIVTLVYVVMTLTISGILKVVGYRLFRRPA
jgi:ABC-type amino acid transport system permease subunit